MPSRRKPSTDPRVLAFARLIADARNGKGYSLDELAALTGLHRTTISNVELGITNPQLTTLLDLTQGLEIDPALLVRPLVDIPRPDA